MRLRTPRSLITDHTLFSQDRRLPSQAAAICSIPPRKGNGLKKSSTTLEKTKSRRKHKPWSFCIFILPSLCFPVNEY